MIMTYILIAVMVGVPLYALVEPPLRARRAAAVRRAREAEFRTLTADQKIARGFSPSRKELP